MMGTSAQISSRLLRIRRARGALYIVPESDETTPKGDHIYGYRPLRPGIHR